MVTWLAERSVDAVRATLAQLCPELDDLSIGLHDMWVETGNPLWARSSAFVGDAWVVKFAWSEPAAIKLEREIRTLLALATSERPLPVRRVHAWSSDPVLMVSPFVPGSPVLGDAIAQSSAAQVHDLGDELARVLAAFHDPTSLDVIRRSSVQLPAPTPQARTYDLRSRLCPVLDSRRRALVGRWCDWADGALTAISPSAALLHGDFHGYNLVVDDSMTVQVVLDLEEASIGDFHYDFRYLPAQEPTLRLFRATVASYERLAGRHVALDRVMAWHLRTVLGDALWRTEANVALPGGGTPEKWIDELDARMTTLV